MFILLKFEFNKVKIRTFKLKVSMPELKISKTGTSTIKIVLLGK